MAIVFMGPHMVYATAEVACHLETGVAPADVKISAAEKTVWTGKIEKARKKPFRSRRASSILKLAFFDQQLKKNQKLTRPLFASMCEKSSIDVTMPEGS